MPIYESSANVKKSALVIISIANQAGIESARNKEYFILVK